MRAPQQGAGRHVHPDKGCLFETLRAIGLAEASQLSGGAGLDDRAVAVLGDVAALLLDLGLDPVVGNPAHVPLGIGRGCIRESMYACKL